MSQNIDNALPSHTEAGCLRSNAVGMWHIVLFVIAAAAPLTVVVGALPVTVSLGVGPGVPGVFLFSGIIYLLFAVGYAAMSRFTRGTGAFYNFVTSGLGSKAGGGVAMVALLAYNAVQISVYAALGYFVEQTLSQSIGVAVPWWAVAVIAIFLVQWIGARDIGLSGRILGALLMAEIAIVLAISLAAIYWRAAHGGLSYGSFAPAHIFTPGLGISTVFVIAAFIGIEATAIFSEEARDRKKTLPRATWTAVGLITLFYVFTSWAIIQYYGEANVVAAALAHPADFWLLACRQLLGNQMTLVFNVLVVTSMFACVLAFHNSITRYLLALARDGIIWRGFAQVHGRYRSPWVASRGQTAVALGVTLAAALLRLDPYNVVFTWLSSLASLAMLAIQILACLAIITWFRAHPQQVTRWASCYAPTLSAVMLAGCFMLAVNNLSVMSNAGNWVSIAWPAIILATLLGGWLWAARQQSRSALVIGG
ncbi:APC family permease [Shimwellia pseudoproteus]|uniref:APC family permease n=1 Tax=Shimwellia pseudoproteus TaxID=570012 RepID=UPI0018EAC0B7|nr:APC family permease [Shimwellia pseudoproteus]MBJ3815853.1 APC family permease [Shimwellia pseudoproteus]